jgi:glycerate 2-kinase
MPPRSNAQLRHDALEIWRAGVAAVDSTRLVRGALSIEGDRLVVDDNEIDLTKIRRIVVVGCGKAGAGMAAGVEEALGDGLAQAHDLRGWVNVPEDCVRRLKYIELHGARPAGRNEPTEAGVLGTIRMLEMVELAGPDDLVICLISGGGSALMPAPINGVSLADKQAVTKFLSGAGANIAELNTVRKALSRVKGGGLARSCRAGRLIAIVISDVLGDPLDVIASGPTVPSTTTAVDALAVLERFGARKAGVPAAVFDALERRRNDPPPPAPSSQVTNLVVGNNATAVDAAGVIAERLGYSHAMVSARASEGAAEEIGRHLAEMAVRMRSTDGPDCLISGGEPTVTLVPEDVRGLGGRNQQLTLAALESLAAGGSTDGVVILSGGTDGEDGPTDAAGAIIDPTTAVEAERRDLVPADYLRRNDAYHFFDPLGGLIRTGPTHTNVCDLRVVVVSRPD